MKGGGDKDKVLQQIVFLIRDWQYDDDYKLGFDGGHKYYSEFVHPTKVNRNQLMK